MNPMTKEKQTTEKSSTDQITKQTKDPLFHLLKKSVQTLNPYHVDPVTPKVKLDANENNWLAGKFQPALKDLLGALPIHHYPDTECTALRLRLAELNGVNLSQVLTGVGSDQIIAWIVQAFVEQGDRVQVMDPTFSMYEINTMMLGGLPVRVPLAEGFVFESAPFLAKAKEEKPKVVFITNPNNPTGGVIPRTELVSLIRELAQLDCIIAVDEAYYEFYGETAAELIEEIPQLIVLRTLSKAYGLAGVRAGYALASEAMMESLARVKPPYHMSSLDQMAALVCLEQTAEVKPILNNIIQWRSKLEEELKKLNLTVFPSRANFLLVRTPQASKIDKRLQEEGILVRSYGESGPLANCLRITVGTEEENQLLLEVFKKMQGDGSPASF